MAKPLNKDNLSYLGLDFQYRLINQILTDRRFGESIIEIVNPQYFEDMHLKIIVATIKDAYSKYDNIPDIESLKIRLVDNVKDEIDRNVVISYIRRIKESEVNDTIFIQDTSRKFFKKQELKKAIKEITTVMEKGSIDDYDIAEDIIKKALEHGNKEDNIVDISDNIESVLEDDYRKPIPTGIEGLDKIMDGGLARGELAIILAAWGVGKTTFVTQIANHAKFAGYNVLQIFFEDNIKVIQRKHISCYTHVPLNDLKYHRNQVLETFKTFQESEGQLKLVKLKSTGVTIPTIKKIIKKKISEGFRPDLILLDYIDCVKPTIKSGDINEDQGATMREFETMLEELNVAGWTCVQGNRSSIKADVVEGDQMGGSIKRAQIGHFLLSVAKTLPQKESGKANIAILKSRFGDSGMVYEDVIFDNARVHVHFDESYRSGFAQIHEHTEEHESQRLQNNVSEILEQGLGKRN